MRNQLRRCLKGGRWGTLASSGRDLFEKWDSNTAWRWWRYEMYKKTTPNTTPLTPGSIVRYRITRSCKGTGSWTACKGSSSILTRRRTIAYTLVQASTGSPPLQHAIELSVLAVSQHLQNPTSSLAKGPEVAWVAALPWSAAGQTFGGRWGLPEPSSSSLFVWTRAVKLCYFDVGLALYFLRWTTSLKANFTSYTHLRYPFAIMSVREVQTKPFQDQKPGTYVSKPLTVCC